MDKPCQCGHSKAEHLNVKVKALTGIEIYRQCSKCMCIDYCAFSDEEYQDYRERTKEVSYE